MALISPLTAAEMAARSHEARRRNKELREQEQQAIPPEAQPEPQPSEQPYTEQRLIRVRKQIDSLSDMMESETDPNKLDRLANAISRMSELERQLAGRPLPGTLKPSAKSTQPRRTVSPVGVEPTIPSVPADPTSTQ